MERVQSIFSNVYGTPAGHLVERATSSSLVTEDWALIMELCDTVNAYGDGTKDVIKALKKRCNGNKNLLQISLSMSILEACIKNCGDSFFTAVSTKEFSTDFLLKLIQPKNNPTPALQERVLGVIKTLAEDPRSSNTGVKLIYMDMIEKGYSFPAKTASVSMKSNQKHKKAERVQPAKSTPGAYGGVSNPTPQQIVKVRKDLAIVLGNVHVFSDMLTHLNPLLCEDADLKLLHELNRTCKAMQQRIVELMEQIGNEEITVEILTVNDDLNNVFLRYERFEKFRSNQEALSPPAMSDTQFQSRPVMSDPNFHPSPVMPDPHFQSSPPMSDPLYSSLRPHYPSDPIQEPPPSYSATESNVTEVNDLIDLSVEPTPVVMPSIPPGASKVPDEVLQLNLGASFNGSILNDPNPTEQVPDEILQLGSSEQEIEQWLSNSASTIGASGSNLK